jgi:hypothetical protein
MNNFYHSIPIRHFFHIGHKAWLPTCHGVSQILDAAPATASAHRQGLFPRGGSGCPSAGAARTGGALDSRACRPAECAANPRRTFDLRGPPAVTPPAATLVRALPAQTFCLVGSCARRQSDADPATR